MEEQNTWLSCFQEHFAEQFPEVKILFDDKLPAKTCTVSGNIIFVNSLYKCLESTEYIYVKDVLAHILAHIEMQNGCQNNGHDEEWRKRCIALGGSGRVKENLITPSSMNEFAKEIIRQKRKSPDLTKEQIHIKAAEVRIAAGEDPTELLTMYM